MRFDAIVMQVDGQITDRRRHETAALRGEQPMCAVVDEAASMLSAHLSPDAAHCGNFRAEIASSGGYVIHWRQPQPNTALACIQIDDRPFLCSLFLFGGESVTDAIAVKTLCEMMASWTATSGPKLTRAFDTIRQRPIVILFPMQSQPTRQQQKVLSIITVCFATAFFERAAAFDSKVDVLYRRIGGSRPRHPSEHRWN